MSTVKVAQAGAVLYMCTYIVANRQISLATKLVLCTKIAY